MKQQVADYFKKLITLGLLLLAANYAIEFVHPLILLPAGLLIYSFMYYRITGIKPPYLFTLPQVEKHVNKKGGFWNFFKLLISPIGFVYDIIVWIIWAVYLLFELVLDFIWLVKEVLFWIAHAILWFLKLFVPPIVFLYKMFIHYLVKWTWWIYQVSFKNIRASVTVNYYLIALWGTLIAMFSIFLFLYLDIMFETSGLVYIGAVLALIPLSWSFAEIASVRHNSLALEPYYEATGNFENGFENVKYLLYFLVTYLILFIVQAALDLFGWLQGSGLSFLGFALNINTAISIAFIFLTVFVFFATIMLPSHLLHTEEQETPFNDLVLFLKTILKKGLRYILSFVPTGFYSIVLMVIPAVIVGLGLYFTVEIKNDILDRKIETYQETTTTGLTKPEQYHLEKKIDRLEYYKDFPMNIFTESFSRSYIAQQVSLTERKIQNGNEELADLKSTYSRQVEQMEQNIKEARNIEDPEIREQQLEVLNAQKEKLDKTFQSGKERVHLAITKRKMDKDYLQNMRKQIPYTLFFMVLWISIFGGLVVAFSVAFFGNVFYVLYQFHENDQPTYWTRTLEEIKAKDGKQPLLGFSLMAIVTVLVAIMYLII